MASLPNDLFAIILAKLPLKRIFTSKLVCKQWKSIVESKFFYQLFQFHHQNSHSLWSLMCFENQKEVIAHYKCNNWGLTESLGSYISSFITSLVHTEGIDESVKVVAYSEVGLMLITSDNLDAWYKTYYVANPISREYIKIPPLIPCTNWETAFETSELVTQVENDIILSYKIVLMDSIHEKCEGYICKRFLIYASDTCLWSFKTIQFPVEPFHSISLDGNLYWSRYNVLVYYNFYATGTECDRCKVIHFPAEGENNKCKEYKYFKSETTSQGSLMYIKIFFGKKDDDSFVHKLSVWRLNSREWQLVSEISLDFLDNFLNPFFNFHLTLNPFDAKTFYFWSEERIRLASINLDKCKMELYDNLECSSDGCNQRIYGGHGRGLCKVVLPRWPYRIPCCSRSGEK